jgi:hypothetical protein
MTTIVILGIEIPSELQTKTIINTNWSLIQIKNVTSLERSWIGRRRSQLSITLIDFLLKQDRADLQQRKNVTIANINYIFEYDDHIFDERVRKEELLGQLRYLWLLECLLAQNQS